MPLRLPPDLMVSVSGIRGRVGDPLTPELVCGAAAAFGAGISAVAESAVISCGIGV